MARGMILFGGMGVGDSTLGRAAAKRLHWPHIDLDDFIWRWDTEIPFTVIRPRAEKIALLNEAIARHPHFVMSGSMFTVYARETSGSMSRRTFLRPASPVRSVLVPLTVRTPSDMRAAEIWVTAAAVRPVAAAISFRETGPVEFM